METAHTLAQRLEVVPQAPGVYIFKDTTGRFLYVGKAARLRDRLRNYFSPPHSLPDNLRRMMPRAADLEVLLTHSESEALILENTLIKRHKPPFNTRLRDDKEYPYIKVDLTEAFPRVYITRKVLPDGARYFGPFASAGSVRRTLDLLKKLFPYRSCTKVITGTDPRPCLEYYIHRCVAPCTGYASQGEYQEVIQQMLMFLEGKTEVVLRLLHQRLEEAAEKWQYERAAILRDQIQSIQQVMEEQKVVTPRPVEMDVVALAQEWDEALVEVFFIRQGKLLGHDHFVMDGAREQPPGRVLSHFLRQFYHRAPAVPPILLLQHPVEEAPLIQQWLREKRGGPVRLEVPRRGLRRRLVAMAAQNALQGLRMLRASRLTGEDALTQAMEEVQEALHLPRLPHRMECYDISTIMGRDAVGSMVVFEEGRPRPAHYRRFKIKSPLPAPDDYEMMREVLRRRFRRLAHPMAQAPSGSGDGQRPPSHEAWGILPDLVLIDGGKGHLSAALQVMLELGLSPAQAPLAALAKEEEEVFLPEAPEPRPQPPPTPPHHHPTHPPRTSPALFLLQRIRDEAHRFALAYHQKVRSRRQTQSALDSVPGIGPKRKRLLLRRFGSLRAIKEAPLEDLAAVPGMTRTMAQKLKEYL